MRRLVVCALVALLASGCTGGPQPVEPEPSGSASASPTPSAAPTMPEQAREDSHEGAASFVYFWVATFNYSAQIADSSGLRQLSEDCSGCSRYAQTIDSEPPVEGDIWRVLETEVISSSEGFEVIAQVEMRDQEGRRVESIGFVLTTSTPRRVADLYLVES